MAQNRSSAVMQQRSEANEIVLISTARNLGLRWYFTGKPCAKGHVAKRSISNRECRKCVDDKRSALRIADPDRSRQLDRDGHARRRDRRNEQSRLYRARHAERNRAYESARYRRADRRQSALERAKQWNAENPAKRNAICAARRAHIKRATPPWLTAEDKREIREIYRRARSYGPGVMHVDHDIPLRGKLICGLHVPGNLRIIPRRINLRKTNSYGPE